MNSNHYTKDRKAREEVIAKIGQGKAIKAVVVDRNHRNGLEVHIVTDTALVLIFNKESKKLITKLIARPAQITRYFNEDEVVPKEVLELARYHSKMGWNKL